MKPPSLAIIIITLNEEQRLPLLLGDLQRQTWTDFEIIHVDSNSTDQTLRRSAQISAQFAHYRIIDMQQRGVSLGRNMGARQARADRLLFLDSDTRLAPDFLETALQELQQRDLGVGIVCMATDGLAFRHRVSFGLFNAGIRLTSHFFPTAIGACLFSAREIHAEIGGFDERLRLCEDCHYVLKASKAQRSTVGVLRSRFDFDPRRLDQDGFLRTGFTYFRANLYRFFRGELVHNQIPYEFGHYRSGPHD
ncbi:glycosyltransferase [Parasedimentitalea psychrophila]|uniref:Glycosyltransferase n=1 Tax=Parasedimentitalea psychrophila TaxID=2997337 RepID=A0A9Y2L2Y7_9RHOB|nr:glycosyltransferase [Parasedimentitalea psychrophila]WIY27785.1 glycosyltransferase [Parasedimentitalea psychrophila]